MMPSAHAADTARSALKFSRVLTADCMLHRSRLVRIENTDPTRAVHVVLQSYLGKTRSQDATRTTLAPASGPIELGCDGVSGLKRRWQIQHAEFVAPGGGDRRADDAS